MFKKILAIIILFGFITGCSEKSEQIVPQVEKAATSQLVEFGVVKSTDSAKLLSASIYNDTGSNLVGPATISNSSFSFISGFNCSAGAKNKTSCSTIKISFTPQGKDPGEYNATLNLGSISVPIHATIEAPAVPSEAELAALITSSLGDNVDFGTMISSGSSILKTISLTNGTGQTLNLPVVSTNIGPFALSYDNCSNKAIAKGASCLIKVSFSPTGRSGIQSGSISYSGRIINFSASVVTPESVAQSGTPVVVGGVSYAPNLQFLVGSSIVTEYSFPNGVKTVTVSLKNNGNLSSIISNLVMTGSPNYSLMSNTCLNKSLAPGATCSVKVLGANALPNSSISLSFADKTLSLTMPSNIPNEPTLSFLTFSESMMSSFPGTGQPVNYYYYSSAQGTYSNFNVAPGDEITFYLTSNSNTKIDGIYFNFYAGSVEVKNSQGQIIPSVYESGSSILRFNSSLNLTSSDILYFKFLPNYSGYFGVTSDSVFDNNLFSVSLNSKNGQVLNHKMNFHPYVVDYYEANVQLRFERFAMPGMSEDISLIEGKRIKVSSMKFSDLSVSFSESEVVTNVLGINLNPSGVFLDYFNMTTFLSESAQFFYPISSGTQDFLVPVGVDMFNIQINLRSKHPFTYDYQNIKIPILE